MVSNREAIGARLLAAKEAKSKAAGPKQTILSSELFSHS
jgi:hypothetical protein